MKQKQNKNKNKANKGNIKEVQTGSSPNWNFQTKKVPQNNKTTVINKELMFSIATWNVRSLNSFDKLKHILELQADIILLQEIWTPRAEIINNIEDYISYTHLRGDGYGGTMLLNRNNRLKPISNPSQINDDSSLLKMNVAGDRNIWISSIYLNKKLKKNLLNTLSEAQKVVPSQEWPYVILGGDWNINIRDKEDKVTKTLDILCKKMGLTITSCECLRKENEIDYFIHGSQIEIITKSNKEMSASDHNSAWIQIKVKAPVISTRNSQVPDKKLAEKITQSCLNKSQNGVDFLRLLEKKYKYNQSKLMKTIRIQKKENELLERILDSTEDDDTFKIVKEYWREKAEDCENNLLDGQLHKAFQFLKKVTKFNEFQRRDGSIINRVQREDGSVTYDQDEVNRLIIANLQKIQTSDQEPKYTDNTPYPLLQPLSTNEMDYILSKLFAGKATSFDGVSDILFSQANKPVATNKLIDIWSTVPENHHFHTRLIPLNKNHPNTPTPKDCRPIAVCSALLKLIESRSRKTLETYMTMKLHRGQTGFVPGMGISVNQMRMVQRIKEITGQKKHCYGLFVDCSNAYNTIYHTKLFERLQKVLPKEEIELIRGIYSKTKIKLGQYSFTPNIGVAQGSIISPFLFNIYSEDLYYTLEKDADIPSHDLMGYADDLLIICTSLHQLRQAIKVIKKWSTDNNLLLNPKKSGIIEFLPRAKTYPSLLKIGQNFEDIPVVQNYKYLGLYVDQKLTLSKQLEHITEKVTYQCSALWSILKAFSLTERINLWTVIARPLFEMMIFPYYAERSKSNIDKVHKKIRWSFKKFCLMKKNTSNEIIDRLMKFDYLKRAGYVVQVTQVKWNTRLAYKTINPLDFPKTEKNKDDKVWYPKELAEFINIKAAICKNCGVPCNSYHLKEEHNITIPSNNEILDYIEEESKNLSHKRKLTKKEVLLELGKSVGVHYNKIVQFLNMS